MTNKLPILGLFGETPPVREARREVHPRRPDVGQITANNLVDLLVDVALWRLDARERLTPRGLAAKVSLTECLRVQNYGDRWRSAYVQVG